MTSAVPTSALPGQVLEFTLGGERYCVGIERIEEIARANDVTPLPNTPPQIAGVMNLRGESTTILDPTAILEIDAAESGQQVIVFDSEQRTGWLVDRVHQVSSLEGVDVDTVPDSPHASGLISDDGQFTIWVELETVNGSVSV